jgi:hypothetical protein
MGEFPPSALKVLATFHVYLITNERIDSWFVMQPPVQMNPGDCWFGSISLLSHVMKMQDVRLIS